MQFGKRMRKPARGRFHQLSTYSFYVQGAQMHEKYSQVVSIFMLSGSTSVKAERKYVGEIDTRCVNSASNFIEELLGL